MSEKSAQFFFQTWLGFPALHPRQMQRIFSKKVPPPPTPSTCPIPTCMSVQLYTSCISQPLSGRCSAAPWLLSNNLIKGVGCNCYRSDHQRDGPDRRRGNWWIVPIIFSSSLLLFFLLTPPELLASSFLFPPSSSSPSLPFPLNQPLLKRWMSRHQGRRRRKM